MTITENVIRETGAENLEKVVLDPVGVTQQFLDNVNLKQNVHILRLDPNVSNTNTYNVGEDLTGKIFKTGVKDLEDLFYTDELVFNISSSNPSLKNKFLKLDNWTYTRNVVQNCDSTTLVESPFHLIDSLKEIYNEYNNGWDNISIKDKLNLTKTLSKLRYITDFRNACGEEIVGLNLAEFKNVADVQSCNLFNITGVDGRPNEGKDASLNRSPIGHFLAPLTNSLDTGTMVLPEFPVHTSATALLVAEIRSPNMHLPNVEIHFPLKFDTSVVKYNVIKTYNGAIPKDRLLENIDAADLPKVDSPVIIVNDFTDAMIVDGNYTITTENVFGKITGFKNKGKNPEISQIDTESLELSVYTISVNQSGRIIASTDGETVLTGTQIKQNSNVEMFYCVETTPPEMIDGKINVDGDDTVWKRLKINTN